MSKTGLKQSLEVIAPAIDGADPLGATQTRMTRSWIEPAVGLVATVFGAPAVERVDAAPSVHLTLLGVIPLVSARISRQPEPLRMAVRFLVTAAAATPADADRLIVALGFAALASGQPEVEREIPPSELWLGLAVPAQPALIVREILEQSRHSAEAPLVRQPIVARWAPSRTVTGWVTGPGAMPIAGARIEVTALGLTTHSDHRGEFVLAGIPLGPPYPNLTITAKGVQVAVRADPGLSEPLQIRLPIPEL